MDRREYSSPVPLSRIQVTDNFWKNEIELVRKEMIPYQWKALNDQVEGAAPSFCIHNFRVAGKLNEARREQGSSFVEPEYTNRGFEVQPEDMNHIEDQFYGFVFQDSDFYKWIEAVAYSLVQHPDKELEAVADGAIDVICAAQQEDGYLDTYYIINGKDKIFSNLKDNHELYCFGHLTEAAAAYYQATGKEKLLQAAERFADYIDAHFGREEGKKRGYPGHEIAEMALVRLYEVTGKEKYLNLSRFFIDERGTRPYYFDSEHPEAVKPGHEEELRYAYHQAHVPVREQDEAVGHAVRAVYLYSGMADVARYFEDGKLFAACEKLWDNITEKKMYITGGIGGTRIGEAFSFPYDLPNDTAYAETCASIGLVFFARRMLQIKPDSKYGDVMERALYNGILSGMALDGKSFFYVNPLEVVPEACHNDERKTHVKPVRQKWFGCACCPPNLARLVSSVGSYACTENEDTLFVHLYIGGVVKKQSDDRDLSVQIRSGLPWNGEVAIKICGDGAPFTLALRIPDWGRDYQIEGAAGAEIREKDGYLYLTKTWGEEETIHLHFPMEIRLMEANPLVREDFGKAAFLRGPVVYCSEEADNGKYLHLTEIAENPSARTGETEIAGVSGVTILADGYRYSLPEGEGGLYKTAGKQKKEPCRLQFIPYYMWANRGENEMQVWTRLEGR